MWSYDHIFIDLYINNKYNKCMNKASRKEIGLYLDRIKELVNDDSFYIVRWNKNMKTLLDYNLSINDVKNILLSLEIGNYYSGPNIDDDYLNMQGDIWIFIRKGFYIKFKIIADRENTALKILSFHKEEL